MNWARQCAVIIPCLDEAKTIGPLLAQVMTCVPTVVVIDDGSQDATTDVALSCGAHVIRNGKSRGKGAALDQGMRWVDAKGFTWALTMDGDGQHLPSDIPGFFEAAQRTSASMIVGNRMRGPTAMPWLRRQVNKWMSRQLANFCGELLPDTQCGFRLVDVSVWLSMNLTTRHFEIESESLLLFVARRKIVHFVPIQTVYGVERSKIRPILDSARWLWWYWNIRNEGNSRYRHLKRSAAAS
jgi:glycosyltransferase involved in cell wall biosynthesis